MKKFTLLFILSTTLLFAFNTNIKGAYAIGIFDENGNGENIQHVRKTKSNYNGTCYTKIFVIGNSFKLKPKVTIGTSIGHYQSSKQIYNNRKIKIGEVMIFKHFAVSHGNIKVSFKDKLYDAKVFVK